MKTKILLTLLATASAVFAQAAQNHNTSAQDRQFVDKAAQLNMTEAHSAKLAEQKAELQTVKDFAQTLDKDHSEAYRKLSDIGRQDGFAVPTAIDQQHQQEFQALERLSVAPSIRNSSPCRSMPISRRSTGYKVRKTRCRIKI